MFMIGFLHAFIHYEGKFSLEEIMKIVSHFFGTEQGYEPYLFKTRFHLEQNQRVL